MNKEKIIYNLSPDAIREEILIVVNNARELLRELYVNSNLSYVEKIQLITNHIYYIKLFVN
jgi:hypothetical protein